MVSAVLVVIVATAVFKGIDGAAATSGKSKSQAIAVNLAHEDQERMRSMNPSKLSAYNPGPVQKTVNGAKYTLDSTAQLISDRGESESCTKGDGRVVHVRITSTVTWSEMSSARPVVASSLVAIPNSYGRGGLGVKIVDRTNAGVEGVAVSLDAPVSQSKLTNSAGCVVFDGLAPGSYFGQFTKTGYVDMNGVTVVRPVNGWSVTTGATSISTHVYDRAGSAELEAFTRVSGTDYTAPVPGFVMAHPQIPGPPTAGEFLRNLSPAASNTEFLGLFPFTDTYTAFPLACTGTRAGVSAPVTVPQGGEANAGNPVRIQLPSLNVIAQRNGGTVVTGQHVTIRPVTGSCMPAPNPRTWTAITEQPGVSQPSTTSPNVPHWHRGLPPGDYQVCVDANISGNNRRNRQNFTLGTTDRTVTVNVNSSSPSTSGLCP